MRSSLARISALVLVLFGATGSARAQQIASSFEQLQVLVGPGDIVTVTGASGGVMTGRILDLSASTLRLQVDGQSRNVAADDVRTITQNRHANLATGAMWGLPVGIVFGALANRSLGGDWSAANLPGILWFGGIGAGIGVGFAAATVAPHVIFAAPASQPKVTLSPLMDRERRGVQMAWRF